VTDDLAAIRRRLDEGYAAPSGEYPGPYQAVADVAVLLSALDAVRARVRRLTADPLG
jgi:hypothetical protein